MNRMFLAGLVAAVALLLAAPVRADSAKATAHFEKGTRLYQVGEYDKALAEFKAGHVEEPDASFLFNIAQCHRLMGQPRAAITFYKRFLSLSPDTPMRGDVERKINDLEDELHRQPIPPAPPPLATRPASTPELPAASAAAIEDRHSLSGSPSRWPMWLGTAVTVGLAGAATAMTMNSNSRYNELRESCGRQRRRLQRQSGRRHPQPRPGRQRPVGPDRRLRPGHRHRHLRQQRQRLATVAMRFD